MRNEFICEIPESVREYLPRPQIESLDLFFEDLDAAEDKTVDDDESITWDLSHLYS